MNSQILINIAAKTDVGKERERNEDAFVICPDLKLSDWGESAASTEIGSYGSLLVVTDGMGGANAGDVASETAISAIKAFFTPSAIVIAIQSPNSIEQFLKEAVSAADAAIQKIILERSETSGMGTTIVICWIMPDIAYIAWCGDSRCYVYNRHDGLHALTKDHSYVQELVDKGEITEQEAYTHPDNNVITRGLGDFDERAMPDIVTYHYKSGDLFMLCSDGLCGYCTDDIIKKIIKANRSDAQRCCDELMELALNAGGQDNICIVTALVSDKKKRFFLFR